MRKKKHSFVRRLNVVQVAAMSVSSSQMLMLSLSTSPNISAAQSMSASDTSNTKAKCLDETRTEPSSRKIVYHPQIFIKSTFCSRSGQRDFPENSRLRGMDRMDGEIPIEYNGQIERGYLRDMTIDIICF